MNNSRIKVSLIFLCRSALLSAVGIVLSAFESALPDFPFVLPGMKLGLANIAVILAIDTVGFWGAFAVVIIKAGFALLTRGATAAVMSLFGGVLSLIIMYLCTKCKRPQFGSIGLGIAGAFSHNMGQLIVACVLVGNAVFGYGAALSLVSILSGGLTGLTAGIILRAVPFDKLTYG